jgi:hypothetical protein
MPAPRCTVCPGRPALSITQPDDSDYVRLVAICPDCGRWYLRLEPPGAHYTLEPLPVPTLEELGIVLELADAV